MAAAAGYRENRPRESRRRGRRASVGRIDRESTFPAAVNDATNRSGGEAGRFSRARARARAANHLDLTAERILIIMRDGGVFRCA